MGGTLLGLLGADQSLGLPLVMGAGSMSSLQPVQHGQHAQLEWDDLPDFF